MGDFGVDPLVVAVDRPVDWGAAREALEVKTYYRPAARPCYSTRTPPAREKEVASCFQTLLPHLEAGPPYFLAFLAALSGLRMATAVQALADRPEDRLG